MVFNERNFKMAEVKVGDTFSRYHDWSNSVLDTRTVTKVTEKKYLDERYFWKYIQSKKYWC